VNYSVPFYDDHWKYVASIGASIEVHWLTDVLDSLKVGDEGYVFLITPNGTMVSHPRGEWIMKETVFTVAEEEGNREKWDLGRKMRDGERGLGSFTNLRTGDRYLIYYQPIEGMGWSLGIVFPEKVILAGVTRLSHTQMALGLLGMGGMLLVALATARRITRPIRALSDATQVLASGHLEAPLPSGKGHDEVAHLTVSFATMRDSLLNHMKDLAIARSIQMSLVPRTFPPFPDRRDFDLFALLEPAREVGGDFFDFFMTDPEHFALVVADVSGKGMPAALYMAVTRTLLRSLAKETHEPSALLRRLNDELATDNESCMFVTIFYALVDLRTGETRYASAGHQHPYRVPPRIPGKPEAPIRPLPRVKGPVAGGLPGMDFPEGSVRLDPGDLLLFYTDGVTEAMNPREELFGEEALAARLDTLRGLRCEELIGELREDLRRFAEETPQSDDITLLAFRYERRAPETP